MKTNSRLGATAPDGAVDVGDDVVGHGVAHRNSPVSRSRVQTTPVLAGMPVTTLPRFCAESAGVTRLQAVESEVTAGLAATVIRDPEVASERRGDFGHVVVAEVGG